MLILAKVAIDMSFGTHNESSGILGINKMNLYQG